MFLKRNACYIFSIIFMGDFMIKKFKKISICLFFMFLSNQVFSNEEIKTQNTKNFVSIPKNLKATNLDSNLFLLNSEIGWEFQTSSFAYNIYKIYVEMYNKDTENFREKINSEINAGLDINLDSQEFMNIRLCTSVNNTDFYNLIFFDDFKNIEKVEKIAVENGCLEEQMAFILLSYIKNNDFDNAKRLLLSYGISFNDSFYYLMDLTLSYLKKGDYISAEELVYSLNDKDLKNLALSQIIKSYASINDTANALKIVNKLEIELYEKNILYIIDSYARQNKIEEINNLISSNHLQSLKNQVDFILNIYQNNFEEAKKIAIENDIDVTPIIRNMIEILLSNNLIDEAKYLLDTFYDNDFLEFDINQCIIYLYLKNNEIEKAKKIRDEVPELSWKWYISKLISFYSNKS